MILDRKTATWTGPWIGWTMAFLAYVLLYGYRLNSPSTPYFDEIGYVEAARNILQRSGYIGEAHPPFGKYLIALSMAFFGDHALAWRIPSFLSGFGIFVLVFHLTSRLFHSKRAAWIAVLILLCEGTFYTLARTALLSGVMLFMMLFSIYFFSRYFFFGDLKRPLAFLAAGVTAGLAVGTRWVGLSLLLIYVPLIIWSSWKESKSFKLLFDFLLFFLMPAVGVYFCVFLLIPFVEGYDLSAIWKLQEGMTRFHATLREYDSRTAAWWTWPLILKPTWFYYDERAYFSLRAHHTVSAIACIGNPVVYWFLPIAVASLRAFKSLKEKLPKNTGLLLLLGYLSQWIPWAFIARNQYFHYIHSAIPFAAMFLGYYLDKVWAHSSWGRWIVWVYLAAAAVFFVYWFPLLNGFEVRGDFFKGHLWFDGWYP